MIERSTQVLNRMVRGTVLLLAAALVSCATVPAQHAAGLSEQGFENLDAAIQAAIDEQQIAGAVSLVMHRAQPVHFMAYGDANTHTGRDMRANDLFRIASMSKAITSTAALLLYEEKKFQLDDPVAMYLPEFDRDMQVIGAGDGGEELVPATTPITIRHLMTHTSGISYRFIGAKPLADLYTEAGVGDGLGGDDLTLAENVRRLAKMPLVHQPGEAWSYGLNTDVLGRVIEVVSGDPLDVFMTKRVFEPLKMRDTWFEIPASERSRMVDIHRPDDTGELRPLADGVIEEGYHRIAADYPYDGEPGYVSGGAGLTSTTADYARFLQMILNGGSLDGVRLLQPETVELMSRNQIAHLQESGRSPVGYTLAFGYRAAEQAGENTPAGVLAWGGYFKTTYWIDRDNELIALLMTQHFMHEPAILGAYRELVYDALED